MRPRRSSEGVCDLRQGNQQEGVRTFDFHGTPVRLVENSDDLWFCVLELMQALDDEPCEGKQYHPSEAVEDLDEDEVRFLDLIDSTGKHGQPHLCVSKIGMWAIIGKSTSTESKEFRRWMRKDMLKKIDEKGSYSVAPAAPRTFTLAEAFEIALDVAILKKDAE